MDQLRIIEAALVADVPLLIEGHTGSGKTYTIMELATARKKTLHVINVSGELTVDSILGQQTLIDGNVVWRDGVLTTAMKNGDWVLLDEMNTALPEVLTVINGILDDSRSVTLPNAENERVKAHEDFRFIGTQNPATGEYAGTGRLNSALLNRMIKIEFSYMDAKEELKALKKHTKVSDASVRALVDIANYTRQNLQDNPVSTRDLVKVLRLRDAGKLSIRDALTFVLSQKYEQSEYEDVQRRFDDRLSNYVRFTNYNEQADPYEELMKIHRENQEERRRIQEEKRNLRAEVKRELLKDLLGSKSEDGVPKDF